VGRICYLDSCREAKAEHRGGSNRLKTPDDLRRQEWPLGSTKGKSQAAICLHPPILLSAHRIARSSAIFDGVTNGPWYTGTSLTSIITGRTDGPRPPNIMPQVAKK